MAFKPTGRRRLIRVCAIGGRLAGFGRKAERQEREPSIPRSERSIEIFIADDIVVINHERQYTAPFPAGDKFYGAGELPVVFTRLR